MVGVAEAIDMGKRTAVVQSNYIPWKGYFDLINRVDEFVLFDDVQYTRRDWRNRNVIKTPSGLKWLTIPVEVKGKYTQLIRETRIADPGWGKQHWTSLVHNYSRAKYFKQYRELFEPLYLESTQVSLSLSNRAFIEAICSVLGIKTRLTWSWEHPLPEGKNERLVAICKSVNAGTYVSGPSAKGYLDEKLLVSEGIKVEWMSYDGYPEYRQLHGGFEHGVTALDLIFNEGPEAPLYMRSFHRAA